MRKRLSAFPERSHCVHGLIDGSVHTSPCPVPLLFLQELSSPNTAGYTGEKQQDNIGQIRELTPARTASLAE